MARQYRLQTARRVLVLYGAAIISGVVALLVRRFPIGKTSDSGRPDQLLCSARGGRLRTPALRKTEHSQTYLPTLHIVTTPP